MIPDSQGAIKLELVYCSAYKIFTIFSIYRMSQEDATCLTYYNLAIKAPKLLTNDLF